MLKKKAIGSVAAIVLAATTLAACGNDAQNGTFPNYGADEGYNLTNPNDFVDFAKEYETLPDNYIEETIRSIDREHNIGTELDGVKKAGDLFCESTDLKSAFLKVAGLMSDPESISDSDYENIIDGLDERTLEDEYAPIDEALGTRIDFTDADDDEAAIAMTYTLLGGVTKCEKDFSNRELTGAGVLINSASDEIDESYFE